MGKWKECLLGDIVTFQRGYDLPKTKMHGGIYPVVASNGIIGYHDKFTTEEPSITIGRSGSVGKPLLVKGKSWSHNTTLYIKEYKGVDPFFIYYFLKILDLKNYAGGSAVPTLNRNHIHCLPVKIPVDISEQKKIASVLSAYDNLIENNQKQIKLLEEIAQQLYKEWFVNLRFPDYENTSVVDGIPEGWKIDKTNNFFKITIGKTPPRAKKEFFVNGMNGVPWLSIADMKNFDVFVFNTSENLTEEAIKEFNVKIVPAGTVFVSFKLTVGRVAIATTNMCTNEAIAHFYIDDDVIQAYTYFYLKNFQYDTLGNTSSISNAVNSTIIKSMPFIMPKKEILNSFYQEVSSFLKMIHSKQLQIIRLSEARDRLLPKLMSGEIDVSEICI
ncbi:MAG: restriction endonuclease subunit S [Muribaculaceae bacterium]|nr:restriction endonuclease subunit S [Alistipes senegalensis]MCM1473666.1 restriction endonuclease subunit S [Muribaculaceae bacterium]